MAHFDNHIFQQLISDTQFIRWAKGKNCADEKQWENWKIHHSEHACEFDEAVKSVQRLLFSSEKMNDSEIRYLWQKAEGQINEQKSPSRFHKFSFGFARIAAILIVPLLIYSIWISIEKRELKLQYAAKNSKKEITVLAPIGSRSFVELPDGSKAWLNSGTKLSYPAVFNRKARKVKLEGEAYFKVEKNDVPFLVQNLGPTIKVYGTEFNVNSYSDEAFVTVALVEGKISLNVNCEEQFLEPGQVSYFNKSQKEITIKNEAIDYLVCWKEGRFMFRDAPLGSILRILQRRYNVVIELSHPGLGDYKYNATFQDEGLGQILELLQLSAPINYTYIKRDLSADETGMKGKVLIQEDKSRIVKY